MNWPNDADGDVFRSLKARGFDFEQQVIIDINLDFDHWPLAEDELLAITTLYPNVEIINPESGEDIGNGVDFGFLQFQIFKKLNYDFIIELQSSITQTISIYGGWCDSWGLGNINT